jgi:hypothetical protein
MSAQVATYIIFITFFIVLLDHFHLNTSPQPKCAFVLKSIKILNEIPQDSIDIKAQSPIDKYMKHHETLHFKILSDYVTNYNLNENDFKK